RGMRSQRFLTDLSVRDGVLARGQEGCDLDQVVDRHSRCLKLREHVSPYKPGLRAEPFGNLTVDGLGNLAADEQEALHALHLECLRVATSRSRCGRGLIGVEFMRRWSESRPLSGLTFD